MLHDLAKPSASSPRVHADGTRSQAAGNTRMMGSANQAEVSTDAQIVQSSLADPSAFASLFERHASSVHRYLLKRVGPQNAEDLVGETFVTAFRSRTNYDLGRPDARPWLFGIATNLTRHYWRSESRRRSREVPSPGDSLSHDHSDDVSQQVFYSSQGSAIAQALAYLDDAHRDVLLLIAGTGFRYEEVSEALGIPVGTVRSRMSRTRSRLRELLGESGQYLGEGQPAAETSAGTKDEL